jgi:hypothetical protein
MRPSFSAPGGKVENESATWYVEVHGPRCRVLRSIDPHRHAPVLGLGETLNCSRECPTRSQGVRCSGLHEAIDAREVRLLSLTSGLVEPSAFLDVGGQLVVE